MIKTDLIDKARNYAIMAHAGQKRKFSGGDYFEEHCKVVAETIANNPHNYCNSKYWKSFLLPYNLETTIAAAFLHDVLEDTKYNLDNFPIDIQHIVYNLSRKDETYFDYIMRISKDNYQVIAIKLADLECNMKDLQEGSMKDKYRFADYILRN